MTDSNVIHLKSPVTDVLGDLLKQGAQQLLAKAIEAEVAEVLDRHSEFQGQFT